MMTGSPGSMLKITWLAHACFLLEADGLRVLTDPYDPGIMGLPAITEPADIVIRSSADDLAHCRSDLIRGRSGTAPVTVTGTEIAGRRITIAGLTISAVECRESAVVRADPRKNSMYRFRLAELEIAHLGDTGNAVTREQAEFLRGADVALVPAGGPPTIELHDLLHACRMLAFPLVIPMHFKISGAKPRMLPVNAFTSLFRPDEVEWANASSLVVGRDLLPQTQRVVVLRSRIGDTALHREKFAATVPPAG